MKLNCVVIDDEPLALQLLEDYVNKTPFLHLIASCSNAVVALEILRTEKVDVIFTDIQMPDLNGVEFSRFLDKEVRVIFTTAYSHYAIDGFKVGALDYLLKPFSYPEFLESANRALEWKAMLSGVSGSVKNRYFFVKSEYRLIRIEFDDIIYVEGLKDYVKFFLRSQTKPILSLMSLKALEDELPATEFMRIHRSFIVALNAISAIEKGQVVVREQYITVAEPYKERIAEYVNKGFSK